MAHCDEKRYILDTVLEHLPHLDTNIITCQKMTKKLKGGLTLELYKVFIDAKTYPNGIPRCVKVKNGDSIFVLDDEIHSVGEKYKDYNAIITEIVREEKKWWQFWKRKIIYGYVITFE